MGNISKEKRSKIMSSIRAKNTKPEIRIRKLLWSNGFRYRIHDKSVFGTPDISNKSKNFAVFIDGCFWHGCPKCYKEPISNVDYWRQKIARNKKRRTIVKRNLKKNGCKVFEFWEHHVNSNPEKIVSKIVKEIHVVEKDHL